MTCRRWQNLECHFVALFVSSSSTFAPSQWAFFSGLSFLLLSALLLCRRQTAQHKTFCLPLLPFSSHPFLPLILAFCHKLQSESNPPIATSASERRTEDDLCNRTVWIQQVLSSHTQIFLCPLLKTCLPSRKVWKLLTRFLHFPALNVSGTFLYKTHQIHTRVLWLVAKVLLCSCWGVLNCS